MPTAAYQQERRAKAKAAGNCGMCAVRKPRAGMKTCDVCLEHSKSSKKRGRGAADDEWCPECLTAGNPLRHRADCNLTR